MLSHVPDAIDWLNQNSGAIQAIAEELAQLTREQQLDDDRPVLVFRIIDTKKNSPLSSITAIRRRFDLEIANAGVGPALDASIDIIDSPFRWNFMSEQSLPVALAAGEVVTVHVEIDRFKPFVDPLAFQWPRNEDDQNLQHRVHNRNERVAQGHQDNFVADSNELENRQKRFRFEARKLISAEPNPGSLHACYQDIHQRSFESTAELRDGIEIIGEDYHPKREHYPEELLVLGPLAVRQQGAKEPLGLQDRKHARSGDQSAMIESKIPRSH